MSLIKNPENNNLELNVLPAIGMGLSDLVLHSQDQDQDQERSIISGFEDEYSENFNKGIVNPDNAAINIENSSDVIIGPVTQFHGPVTIYQNLNGPQEIENNINKDTNTVKLQNDAKLVKTESTSSTEPPPPSNGSNNVVENRNSNWLQKISNPVKYLIIIIPIILVIITAIVAAGVYFGRKDNNMFFPPPDPDNPDILPPGPDNETAPKMLDRRIWGGRNPRNNTRPLRHPTPLVIISHSATTFCTTIKECSAAVLSFQEYHVNTLGSPDVGYNFLVGGDGNIYIGRGWDIRNFHQDNSIGICFIGNYLYDELSPEMINAALFLLDMGMKMRKLSAEYTIVCHNQTFATQSPGSNVYKIVKTWPHFKPINLL